MSCAITGELPSAPNGYRMPTLPEPLGRSYAPWPHGHQRRQAVSCWPHGVRSSAPTLSRRGGGPASASFAWSASAWLMPEVK